MASRSSSTLTGGSRMTRMSNTMLVLACALGLVHIFFLETMRGAQEAEQQTARSAVHHGLSTFVVQVSATRKASLEDKEEVNKVTTSQVPMRNDTRLPFRPWNDPKLPSWMEEYLRWHTQQRQDLTFANWRSKKYLVQRCLDVDGVCAGLADRLGSLPNTVRFAYDAQRIFLIHWEKPAALEEFLVPPSIENDDKGKDLHPSLVLDWRLPPWLKEQMNLSSLRVVRTHRDGPEAITNSSDIVVAVRQMHTFDYYQEVLQKQRDLAAAAAAAALSTVDTTNNNKLRPLSYPEEETPYHVVRGLWHCMFRPTPPVLQRIQETMQELQVQPAQYVAIHIRALYRGQDQSQDKIHTEVAVDVAAERLRLPSAFSASSLSTNLATTTTTTATTKIAVISDSLIATKEAIRYGSERYKNQGTLLVGRTREQDDTQRLHLDRGRTFLKILTKDAQIQPSSDFYDAFVDLYLLRNSQCVVYGLGGYGRLGALLAHNVACDSISYVKTTKDDKVRHRSRTLNHQ